MAHPATGTLDVISKPNTTPRTHLTHWHREADQFRNYIHHGLGDHAHTGTNGSGHEVPFVCKRALTEYWTRERITAVLDRDGNTEDHIETIETVCLVVFSILCYISCSDYFNHFTTHLRFIDSGLPVFASNCPSTDPGIRRALVRFCEEQWKFIPLDFGTVIHKKRLAAEYILPVVYDQTPLATNDESVVYKVSFDPCCVGERFKSDANSRSVVFKMLGPDESDLWQKEADAYNLLCRSTPNEGRVRGALTHMGNSVSIASSFNYITRYLGSFIRIHPPASPRAPGRGHSALPSRSGPAQHFLEAQVASGPQRPPSLPPESGPVDDGDPDSVAGDILEKNHVIVLEYARGGSLTHFCQHHSSLVTSPDREHRLDLWHQMFHLLQALFVIHSANGTHQDIKDSNVLYMREDGLLGPRRTPCFKLSDFGKSHFRIKGGVGSEARDTNHVGNRIYSESTAERPRVPSVDKLTSPAVAPECCGANEIEQTVPRPYTKAADIWSMGCLFSNMLVRSSLGEEGVRRYRDARVTENIDRGTAVALQAPQCFHDGVNRLSAVEDFHRQALEKFPDDDVLRTVSDIILNNMLRPLATRTDDALTLRVLWINRVDPQASPTRRATGGGSTSEPVAGPSSQPDPHGHVGTSTIPLGQGQPGLPRNTTVPTLPGSRPPTPRSFHSVRPTRPNITVQQIVDHLRRTQKLWQLLQPGAKLDITFPGLLSALDAVKERNHHFMVDTSKTMESYREKVADTVWVLAKLLKSKPPRPGSVKMSIVGDNKQAVYLLHASTKQAHSIRKFRFYDSRGWLLGHRLQRIASEIMDGLVKGPSPYISLYILTDGQFGEEPPDFATPIQALLEKVRTVQNVPPSFLSVTIIRFGGNQNARDQLELLRQSVANLDNLPPAFNPIRICSSDGDVADMLIGSIRDSTTNVSFRGMMERRNTTGIPRG